jgi:hypothetical protein
LLIPEYSSVDIGLHAYSFLEESSDAVHQVSIHIQFFKPSLFDTFQNVDDFFTLPSEVFRIGRVAENEMLVVDRDPDGPSLTDVQNVHFLLWHNEWY